ncbi:copper chaperone PCu(A)C [Pasteurella multocida]|uniref:copper chaperone PCu(A)C n=1 Tax=Pasteurella multocida TaxID=747 RepID=UPI000BBD0E5B|nr:copper chaperone PCu(A)C [Pasteurella multocida]ATF74687.1 molecular chaperone [Pasteurella multocida]ATN17088.1 copper chaperone PCu(A)C [Pasteurella multocida]MCL7817411.1 copper chaperone PCu(A)C [Pasteurella multocida]MEB3457477.1 copper chaperone PCu(A)C [Pasteurella multocida]MEB3488699.1 copper chaperone PCu(A)C [Pasteurella multocida]
MKSLTQLLSILTALLPTSLFAHIHVEQAQMFSAKAGEPSAIFMNIHNTGNEDVSLALVQSDIRADIVLHGTQHGKMIEVTGINLPAHQMTALKRGGLHIMVFNVEQDLNVGDSFPLRLLFDNGEIMHIEAKIIQYQ